MAKARAGFHGLTGPACRSCSTVCGAEYIYSILTHYEENPACAPDGIDGFYYNTAFGNGGVPDSCKDEHGVSTVPGSWIAMPPPLSDDQVDPMPMGTPPRCTTCRRRGVVPDVDVRAEADGSPRNGFKALSSSFSCPRCCT